MKIKIKENIIPIILVGTVLVYTGSKLIKNNRIEESNIDKEAQVEVIDNVDENNNVIVEEKEEKKIEEPTLTQENGLDIEIKKVVVPTTTVNIRESASTDSNKLGLSSSNNSFDLIYQENEDWYKVKYNDKEAYISANYSEVKEVKRIINEVEKIIYITKNTNMLDENMNIKQDVPYLETAAVYKDNGDYYIASVNNTIGLINKEDTKELTDTFVIVDISDQKATLYENNKIIVSTPVVTGKPSTPTTTGLHEIYSITHNRYLIGPDYKTYVDVMMSFHNGEGLHDAEYHSHYENGKVVFSHGWRDKNSFGGEIYKTRGSHGCVNMPREAAMTMYNNLELKDKVLVKE